MVTKEQLLRAGGLGVVGLALAGGLFWCGNQLFNSFVTSEPKPDPSPNPTQPAEINPQSSATQSPVNTPVPQTFSSNLCVEIDGLPKYPIDRQTTWSALMALAEIHEEQFDPESQKNVVLVHAKGDTETMTVYQAIHTKWLVHHEDKYCPGPGY